MSLQFVCGPSGYGKSTYIQERIIKDSMSDPARKYLLIVPDQFTMQTQVRMIKLHPDHAFSHIEVLSFSRLSHRILEEVGGEDIPVLDDTGKNLILRHVAGEVKDELLYMGERIDRYGFISEIKSVISEFLQYGLRPDDVGELVGKVLDHKILSRKLKDIETVYRAFLNYKSDHFLTREETLDIVSTSLHKSELVKNADIYFDGFTGFTPIQERVIQELMVYARRVVFAFTMPYDSDIYAKRSEEDMFYLPGNSIIRLKKLSEQVNVSEDPPVMIDKKSRPDPMLAHLESGIFRYPVSEYAGDETGAVSIYKAKDISEEIRDTFFRINEYVKETGCYYRDIAIVAGDLQTYADELEQIARELDIPVYMDHSRSIMGTAFVEALVSAYDVIKSDYSFESVIRHMRTGFGPLDRDETDELENFLLKTGIRGRSAYLHTWNVRRKKDEKITAAADADLIRRFDRINSVREKVVEHFLSLHNTEISYTRALYEFIDKSRMYEKIKSDDPRIYDKVMGLLDQIESLCGEEIDDVEEFCSILEAGLTELKVGMIPKQSDQILVGDMIRTRLSHVRALFLLGANDCNIPGNISGGGLISDIDREYLSALDGVMLAPTPREQMFTQRLYLYMNMTKPTKKLCVSYILTDPEGKDMQPSYLIGLLCKLFPEHPPVLSETSRMCAGLTMPADMSRLKLMCASYMRSYVTGSITPEELSVLSAMTGVLVRKGMSDICESISDMATLSYHHDPISKELAGKLYGEIIKASVSRLEKFAGCAYSHFLSYGLKIRPRPEYSFERSDMGDVYHKSLEEFSGKIKEEGLTWAALTDADADRWVDDIIDGIVTDYGDTILASSSRNIALSRRIRRVIRRSVDTIRYQITQGDFVPAFFEKTFNIERNVTNGDDSFRYRLNGKIDRLDLCESDSDRYLRIVDYKSGNKDFTLMGLFHGLMLQLPVYLSVAAKENEGYLPAGMLYFHVNDPVINTSEEADDEQAADLVRREMRMNGAVVNDENVILRMDRSLKAGASSGVIHLRLKNDNTPDANSDVYPREILDLICRYSGIKSDELVGRIRNGDISCEPAACEGDQLPCTYCDYASVCRINSKIDGYESRIYEKTDDEELIERMRDV